MDIAAEVRTGRFRSDLFYRLCEFSLRIPALRERTEDILHLAMRFIGLANQDLGKRVKDMSGATAEALQTYAWPGNVRELRSTIRRAVLLADTELRAEHLDFLSDGRRKLPVSPAAQLDPVAAETASMKEAVSRSTAFAECAMLRNALKTHGRQQGRHRPDAADRLQNDSIQDQEVLHRR